MRSFVTVFETKLKLPEPMAQPFASSSGMYSNEADVEALFECHGGEVGDFAVVEPAKHDQC